MDHMKGDRKDEGASRADDLVVAPNEATYWRKRRVEQARPMREHGLHPHQSEAGRRRARGAPCADPHSAAPERFDVRIVDTSDFPAFARYNGRSYFDKASQTVLYSDDRIVHAASLSSCPSHGLRGRRSCTDPDIFAVADINLLLERDMAAACSRRCAPIRAGRCTAPRALLLDCARLAHLRGRLRNLRSERDIDDWMRLLRSRPGDVAPLRRGRVRSAPSAALRLPNPHRVALEDRPAPTSRSRGSAL